MYPYCVHIIVLLAAVAAAAQTDPAYNRMSGWTNHPYDALEDTDVLQQAQSVNEAEWMRFQIRFSGNGPPSAAECAGADSFGYLYLDYGSSPRRFYRCTETGAGEGWDYVELTD